MKYLILMLLSLNVQAGWFSKEPPSEFMQLDACDYAIRETVNPYFLGGSCTLAEFVSTIPGEKTWDTNEKAPGVWFLKVVRSDMIIIYNFRQDEKSARLIGVFSRNTSGVVINTNIPPIPIAVEIAANIMIQIRKCPPTGIICK